MRIAFDANVLSLLLYPQSPVPDDFRTGKPILHAKERIKGLMAEVASNQDQILIPAPALSEALVIAAPDVQPYIQFLTDNPYFVVVPFGTKAAIEIAIRVKAAISKGNKREGLDATWTKISYDRQIVAIAKAEGATKLYSTDRDIHNHCNLWGLVPHNISDIPIPNAQQGLYEEQDEKQAVTPILAPPDIPGSGSGHSEGQEERQSPQHGG